MSNLQYEQLVPEEVVRTKQTTFEPLGAIACIAVGRDASLAELLNGTVRFTADTIIYDQSGVEIDAVDLLSLVDGEG